MIILSHLPPGSAALGVQLLATTTRNNDPYTVDFPPCANGFKILNSAPCVNVSCMRETVSFKDAKMAF